MSSRIGVVPRQKENERMIKSHGGINPIRYRRSDLIGRSLLNIFEVPSPFCRITSVNNSTKRRNVAFRRSNATPPHSGDASSEQAGHCRIKRVIDVEQYIKHPLHRSVVLVLCILLFHITDYGRSSQTMFRESTLGFLQMYSTMPRRRKGHS